MAKLAFLSLSQDGTSLLLAAEDGTRHALPIDEKLRVAVRQGKTAVADIDLRDKPVGPREIQQRVRAGATVAELAESAGLNPDRVAAFAVPVLQERRFIAGEAQDCQIANTEDAPTLGELVTEHLEAQNVEANQASWDAWLRPDGQWTVLCSYPGGEGSRVATWSFDAAARQVACDDDEARVLTGDQLAADTRPHLVAEAVEAPEPIGAHPAGRARTRPEGAESHPAGRAVRPIGEAPSEPAPAKVQEPARPAAPVREPEPAQPSWDQVLFGDDKSFS